MPDTTRQKAHQKRVKAHKYDILVKRYFAALRFLYSKGAFRNLISKNITLIGGNACFARGDGKVMVVAYQNVHGCALVKVVSCSRCRRADATPCGRMQKRLALLPFSLEGEPPLEVNIGKYQGLLGEMACQRIIDIVINKTKDTLPNPFKPQHDWQAVLRQKIRVNATFLDLDRNGF
jgi:hypothetical protein